MEMRVVDRVDFFMIALLPIFYGGMSVGVLSLRSYYEIYSLENGGLRFANPPYVFSFWP